MTSAHERRNELLGLYVLGAVTPDELAEFQAHLADCEACRAEVAALRPVAAGLARIVPQVDPPAGLRERIIRTVTGRSAMPVGQVPSGAPPRTARGLPWLLAAASFVIALALGGYSIQLRSRMADLEGELRQAVTQASTAEQQVAEARRTALEASSQVAVLAAPDLVRFDLAGQPNAPAATARAFWSRSRGMVFTASNLPSPPPGRVYQLWVLTAAGPPISVGLLEPDQAGGLTAVFQTPADIPLPTQVAVSDEPPGGVPAPTGMIWVAGKPAA
jgi:anti-sigma-K factor RskA